MSSDGKTFTFPLREGVKFHDGADMTSADVKATFDRIIFPPDHVSSRRQALFAAVAADGVQAPDEHTFQLVLEEPRAADFILNAFATGFNVIVRKQTLEDNDYDLRTIPTIRVRDRIGTMSTGTLSSGRLKRIRTTGTRTFHTWTALTSITFPTLRPG